MSHILFHLVGRTKEQVLNVSTNLVLVDEIKERIQIYAQEKTNIVSLMHSCICFFRLCLFVELFPV